MSSELTTHHIRHHFGFEEADIYIGKHLQRQLNSAVKEKHYEARRKVCELFYEACAKKYGSEWSQKRTKFEWREVQLTPILAVRQSMHS